MNLFSQRIGIKPVKNIIQVDSMDAELRSSLWNALSLFYWNRVKRNPGSIYGYVYLSDNRDMDILFKLLWHRYFKKPIDTLNDDWSETYKEIRAYFFSCRWYEVYDFIEFISNNYHDEYGQVNSKFVEFCNKVLEQELSAYRFVGGKITEITSKEEVAEIEEALQIPIKPVKEHLVRSVELFADRKNPDYRNSIKEAISAVESICKLIAKDDKTTLGQALKEIESEGKVSLHPALKSAFDKLYGYANDADGIRHALIDQPSVSSEDAKFMLVSCSAFINYLISKSSKAGIKV